jgi:hypothetical protein
MEFENTCGTQLTVDSIYELNQKNFIELCSALFSSLFTKTG